MDDYRDLYEELMANFVVPDDASIEEVDADGVPSLWVAAPGADPGLVTVLAHGGGYCMGSAHGSREFAYRLSLASGGRVLVVDYRLAPENPYPAALDDVMTAIQWTRQQEGVQSVALAGDSAGGALATAAAIALRDAGDPAPTAIVAMSPLVDLAGESPSLVDRAHLDPLPAAVLVTGFGGAYLAGRDPAETPLASPMHADLSGLPPFLVFVCTDEGLHDDAVRLVDKVVSSGGEATLEVGEGMVHIYPLFNFLPEAETAVALAGSFIAKHSS